MTPGSIEFAVCKRLVASDLSANQHEMVGVAALKPLFGAADRTTASIVWVFPVEGSEPRLETSIITFYDARAKSTGRTRRSEWRLYYKGSFMTTASPGDLLLIAKLKSGRYIGMVCPKGSSEFRELQAFSPSEGVNSFRLVAQDALSEMRFLPRSLAAAAQG